MNSRLWNLEKDYNTLTKWWNQHNFDLPVPKDILPSLGIIIEEDDVSMCASGLYIDTGAKFGFMYGLFTNPNINKIKLYRAMNKCLQEIQKLAKSKNLGLIYTITGEDVLFRLYEKNNMTLVENNMKAYVMNVEEEKYKNLSWIMGDDITQNVNK